MDIFNQDAFSLASMLQAVERVDTKPDRLGSLGIFTPNPIRTAIVSVEERAGTLALIKTSARGAPLDQRKTEKRNMRNFETKRIAKGDRILASELQFVRQFGTEDQLAELQVELARRLDGPSGLVAEVEMTMENMRLGAVQGILADADGSPIYNWFTEFGITQATEVDFDLDNSSPASGVLRKTVQDKVVRAMRRKAKGARYSGIRALCGSAFFDDLIAHPEVRETYLNQQGASELREGYDGISFTFGGVTWEEYVGTDDNSTVAIDTDKVKFFPEGTGNTVFEMALSPGEQFSHLGQLGQPYYPMVVPDMKRDQYVDLEVYSYPLFLCKRPEMLLRGKRT
ncbi:MAG: major capsid protein [Candidatus Sedimenticola sp. (ex Thyasira tokunagai)]